MSSNPDSILDSVKKVLGLDAEYTEFDVDVTIHINSTFTTLQQLGVGPLAGFYIVDAEPLWSDFTADLPLMGAVRSYIYLKVQMLFDPPPTSFALESKAKMIQEFEWRLNVMAEAITPPIPPFDPTIPWKDGPDWGDVAPPVVYAPIVVVLPYAPAVGINAARGNVFRLEMVGDCTISAPYNGVSGQHITLEVISNGYTVTWGQGWNFGGAGIPQLSPDGHTDVISAVFNAQATEWYAGYSPGF